MNIEYGQTIRHEKFTARIMKMPDGRHAAEITSTTEETGEAVLWSRVFGYDASIATVTATTAREWDGFMARNKR